MKRAFSLIELMIVVAILGILAAIVIPELARHSQEAKEAAAKDNLRILRNAIAIYAAQHNDVPPGYPNNNPASTPSDIYFIFQIRTYVSKLPANPFNNSRLLRMVGNTTPFPTEATGSKGWIYKPATETIRLDWPGTDNKGVLYYDY